MDLSHFQADAYSFVHVAHEITWLRHDFVQQTDQSLLASAFSVETLCNISAHCKQQHTHTHTYAHTCRCKSEMYVLLCSLALSLSLSLSLTHSHTLACTLYILIVINIPILILARQLRCAMLILTRHLCCAGGRSGRGGAAARGREAAVRRHEVAARREHPVPYSCLHCITALKPPDSSRQKCKTLPSMRMICSRALPHTLA
jgi:hypothetical protein